MGHSYLATAALLILVAGPLAMPGEVLMYFGWDGRLIGRG